MRSKLFVLALIWFMTFPVFAVSSDFSLAIEPYFENNHGYVGEYLFNLNGIGKKVDYAPNGTKQISQLDWDVKFLNVIGNKTFFKCNNLQVRNTLEVGIPSKSGAMKDYDWSSKAGHQTHFSCHENKINGYFSADLLVGPQFDFLQEKIFIAPLIGIDFSRIAFRAYDGYYQYVTENQETTAWTDDIEKKYVYGDIITYRQDRWLLKLGFEAKFLIQPRFAIKTDLFVCPVLNLNSYDSHLRKSPPSDYLDYHMRNAVAFNGGISFEYSAKENLSFVLSVNGSYQNIVSGDTYGKYATEKAYGIIEDSKGGANQWMVGTSLGVRYQFF